MPEQPTASTSYRDPKVQDEDDDDDIDDLDDVLASFNAPAKPTASKSRQAGPSTGPASSSVPNTSQPAVSASKPSGVDASAGEEDFEASLVEGMESLLRQLAGDHPPGVMADKQDKAKGVGKKDGDEAGGGDISAEEEEAAWQRAIEMMLSGEGLEALGLDKDGQPKAGTTGAKPSAEDQSSASTGSGPKPDFNETIRRTMEQLQNPKSNSSSANGGGPDLEALLAQLGSDPRMAGLGNLDGLGGDDEDLGGLLDGMMAQLMTKEVLEEPMSELASKYPAYLAKPPTGVNEADLAKYQQQHTIVTAILATFKKPGYTDEKDGKEVARLVGEMQDLGGPPQEIMGDMPEGFDLGALGNDESCTIM